MGEIALKVAKIALIVVAIASVVTIIFTLVGYIDDLYDVIISPEVYPHFLNIMDYVVQGRKVVNCFVHPVIITSYIVVPFVYASVYFGLKIKNLVMRILDK